MKDFQSITPEQAGLRSENVSAFLDSVNQRKINLHSFMLLKDGKLFAEGYYKPYSATSIHRLYSASKCFVTLAIGKLLGESRIRLSDTLICYFSEYETECKSEELKRLTIEQALTMTIPTWKDICFNGKPNGATSPTRFLESEWIRAFFTQDIESNKPNGTLFSFNSSISFVLTVLIEKITGKTLLEYLRPILDEIGVSRSVECVKTPDGYSWGSGGVLCTLRDFAKITCLFMRKGEINGKQLLPREYMERAVSKLVDPVYDGYPRHFDGFGYHIWTHAYGFAIYGEGDQAAYCFPDKDFIFVCQADTLCAIDYFSSTLYYQIVEQLYKPLGSPIADNATAYHALTKKLACLSLWHGFPSVQSDFEQRINGKKFRLIDSDMGIDWFTLCFSKDKNVFIYQNARGIKEVVFSTTEFVETEFPETHYYDWTIGKPSGCALPALAFGSWTMTNRFLLQVNFTHTHIGHLGMTFEFLGEEVAVRFVKMAEGILGEYQGYAYGKMENDGGDEII